MRFGRVGTSQGARLLHGRASTVRACTHRAALHGHWPPSFVHSLFGRRLVAAWRVPGLDGLRNPAAHHLDLSPRTQHMSPQSTCQHSMRRHRSDRHVVWYHRVTGQVRPPAILEVTDRNMARSNRRWGALSATRRDPGGAKAGPSDARCWSSSHRLTLAPIASRFGERAREVTVSKLQLARSLECTRSGGRRDMAAARCVACRPTLSTHRGESGA